MTSCWTCLTWHKQCAGSSTPCSTCTSLDLPCFGYNTSPPEWLDGGPKQRAQAEYFKNLVKQTLAGRASQGKHSKAKRRKLSSSESAEPAPTSPGPQLDLQRDHLDSTQPARLPENDVISPSLLHEPGWTSDVFQPEPLTFNFNIAKDLLLDGNHYGNDLQEFVQYPSFDLSDSTNGTSASILDSFADCPDITPSTILTSASSGASTRSDCQTRSSLSSTTSTSQHDVGCISWDSNSVMQNKLPNNGMTGLGADDTIALRWFLDSTLPTNFPLMTDEVRSQVHKLITATATRSKVCMAAIRSQMIHHRFLQLDSFGLSKTDHNNAAAEAEHMALIGIQDLLSSNSDPITQIPRLDAIHEKRVTIAVLLLSKVS